MINEKINVHDMSCLTGHLIKLCDNTKIDVESLELDTTSKNNLYDAVSSKKITKENQVLFIKSISIISAGYEQFVKDQLGFVKNGKVYSLISTPVHSTRFSGHFDACTRLINDSETICAIRIHIGAIEFDLRNSIGKRKDNCYIFENISAMLFQAENYAIDLL